jgi:hypothetical protein
MIDQIVERQQRRLETERAPAKATFSNAALPSLIGCIEQPELELLTAWLAGSESKLRSVRTVYSDGFGGIGKSTLAAACFRRITPKQAPPWGGGIWWDFTLEPDFAFVTSALAYVTDLDFFAAEQFRSSERERKPLRSPHTGS